MFSAPPLQDSSKGRSDFLLTWSANKDIPKKVKEGNNEL